MIDKLKNHETLGCCGIDCGLCPRFHTRGNSACPGCGGLNFREKHPSCGFLSCCTVKNGFEACSYCNDYPCKRFEHEKEELDSFVTHKKVFTNLDYIKSVGIGPFINVQNQRIVILKSLLDNFDDGRSKNFYCLCCALLPLEKLQEIHKFVLGLTDDIENKEKIKQIKNKINKTSEALNIELKLNKK